MGEALERLFVIALCAGIAIFCVLDVRRNIRQGYYANVALWGRGAKLGPRILRQDRPANFWSYIVLKIAGAAVAVIFAAIYLALALTR
jgi:hypothetical protein